MPTQIENRREEPRRRIPEFLAAAICFRTPSGVECERRLIEVSLSGASFALPEKIDGIKPGAEVQGAVLAVGDLEIRVHLQVLYLTRTEGNAYTCGARMFPVEEGDRNELSGLLARLESLPR